MWGGGIGRHLFNRQTTEEAVVWLPLENRGDATSLLSGLTIVSAALHTLFSIDFAVRERCNQLKSHCCGLAVKWKYEIIFLSSQSARRPPTKRGHFACRECCRLMPPKRLNCLMNLSQTAQSCFEHLLPDCVTIEEAMQKRFIPFKNPASFHKCTNKIRPGR